MKQLGLDAAIEKVTAFLDIAAYGITSTPGLVLDEQVVVAGRVPKRQEIVGLLTR